MYHGECHFKFSIFEAFEFVASIIAFDCVTFTWTLCSFPCFTLVVDIAP
jgi:hypothetical protein